MSSRGTAVLAGAGGGVLSLLIGIAALAGSTAAQATTDPLAGGQLNTNAVPAQYVQFVLRAGQQCADVSSPLIAAQLEAESGWNPRAVSGVGAQGIAQFMPGTWPLYGRDENADGTADPFDPEDAIAAQARYDCELAGQVSQLIRDGRARGTVTELLLAAYNAGLGAVQRAGGVPQNGETPAYVAKILSLVGKYSQATQALNGDFAAREIAAAKAYLGTPYSWGGGTTQGPSYGSGRGAGTKGFDCSGLVLYAVYQASGARITLPHYADSQIKLGTPVPLDKLQPGDLIAFTHRGEAEAHHIGIYLGQNQLLNAYQTGEPVEITPLSAFTKDLWSAARFG